MKRSRFLCTVGAVAAAAAVPHPSLAADSDITLTTATGNIYGTLTTPNTTDPVSIALIIAGSGPTDRNGNNPGIPGTNDAYKLLAAALYAKGIASVRYDKRGIGASAAAIKSEHDLRFDDYVADAAAWITMLRSDKRFTKVVVAGHSEGALIGTIAAQQAQAAALVTLEGAGRPAPVVLREQLKKNLSPDEYAQTDAILTQLEAGKTVPIPPAASQTIKALFRESVQPYLISWFKYDPAAELGKVQSAINVVQGTADVQVTMLDATDLAKGNPHARLVVVDGMNHVLKHAPDTSTRAAILAGYTDPLLPVEPKVVDTIANSVN